MSSEMRLRLEGEGKRLEARSRVGENVRCVRGGGEAMGRAKVMTDDGEYKQWQVQH